LDNNAVSASKFGGYYKTNGRKLQYHYKNSLSGFNSWIQKSHAKNWLLFGKNLGKHLSLDETSLSNGELYTILTNKNAKGKKGVIVAIVKGTKAQNVISVINKLSVSRRNIVKEVTVDMAGNMNLIAKRCFPKTEIVTDRFHVQKLVNEAVQEERIRLRWEVIENENQAIERAKKNRETYKPVLLDNGDTKRQLLARSRYLLFKSKSKWTQSQILRAEILFKMYPSIEKTYQLSQKLNYIFENYTNVNIARLNFSSLQIFFQSKF